MRGAVVKGMYQGSSGADDGDGRRKLVWKKKKNEEKMMRVRGIGRSSSLGSFGRGLGLRKILPQNRAERGGTLRGKVEDGDGEKNEDAQRAILAERDGRSDEKRRIRSWSPKKSEDFASGEGERDLSGNSNIRREKKAGTWRRLWHSQKPTRIDDISQSTTQSPNQQHKASGPLLSLQPSLKLLEAVERSQQKREQKIARRQARHSYRDSDDYLGVQGVNPRTGLLDSSIGTSSSEVSYPDPDRAVLAAQIKVEEQRKRVEEMKMEYENALRRRDEELRRLDWEREGRWIVRRDRSAGKRGDEGRERNGQSEMGGGKGRLRWRSGEDGWKTVEIPGLSPILQSDVGSPGERKGIRLGVNGE